ncbi:complement C3-like [Protopterus annectens]|uniref:complement C3-like n=1 Tax=Protopterus annectens TaxID=7888 RepID=UPI001CF95277|nr:complement C3-like [Protopterus annectens]
MLCRSDAKFRRPGIIVPCDSSGLPGGTVCGSASSGRTPLYPVEYADEVPGVGVPLKRRLGRSRSDLGGFVTSAIASLKKLSSKLLDWWLRKLCFKFSLRQYSLKSTSTLVVFALLVGIKLSPLSSRSLVPESSGTLLKVGVDKYVSNYETNTAESDKESVLIYLDKIPHSRHECLEIKTNQFFKVGLLQPAAVTIYEYHDPENRCTRFYHPTKDSGLLSKICLDDVCRCAEENCGLQKKYDQSVSISNRIDEACAPGVDYVYKTKLLSVENSTSYDYYKMEILETVKEGSDDIHVGAQRTFITHSNCRESLNLRVNRQYLIMGQRADLWNLQTEMAYIIGKNTWIELWPTDSECQHDKLLKMCTDFQEFSDTLMISGCPS